VIGFAGRILHETEKSGGKYVNSPQTALYDKSRYLYGFSFAKEAIRREKKIVMVEGNLDLILSQQAGVHNTVAVSGTALTEAHVKQLRRLSESVMFAFDIDAAGIEATRRAMDLAHNADLQVSIVDIKGGKDPADIVKSSPDKWIKLVAGAIGSIDFFHKKALDKYMLNDPTEKKKFGVEMLNLLAPHPNEIFKAHWIRVFSKDLNIGEEALWRELDKVKIGEAPQFMEEKEVERKEQSRKERLEERIAGLLLLNPSYASLGDMPTRSECSLASTGVLFESLPKRARSVTVDKFLEALPADVAQLATRLIFEAEIATGDMPDVETEFLDMIHSWRELAIKDKLLLLKREIEDLEKRGDKESARAHMKEFHALTTSLAHVISNHSYHNEKIHKREA
jgi:DNA primase